jgi:3-hydroxyacyl-[acyl-carrier-protein] dehydratase
MNEPATYTTALRIGADHPSLAGHFPGNPIVPGVVLLDHVQQAASSWLGYPVKLSGIPQTKFVQPLLPEQDAHIQLRLTGTELRFSIVRDDATLAIGVMTLAPASSEPRA